MLVQSRHALHPFFVCSSLSVSLSHGVKSLQVASEQMGVGALSVEGDSVAALSVEDASVAALEKIVLVSEGRGVVPGLSGLTQQLGAGKVLG